ncbi:hypothetical protein KPH14_010844 [Odynerus spinipes]|uniref:Kazal-like domain-containing protein n=1 Tax=Odynerus spinipes TaxID=1348599 RepID=A0AAD9VMT4_9HYME|nr:hypothetical protein KPH14_010844 [Odynerus spinipes]
MSRFTISTILIAVVTTNVIAFPQNGLNGDVISEVDGFIFDGPVDRMRLPSTTDRTTDTTERTPGTTIRIPMTRPTPAPTTPGSEAYERCVASCLSTPEYNPVCGTDNVSYDNPGRLNCATTCGKNVNVSFYGRCGSDGIRG